MIFSAPITYIEITNVENRLGIMSISFAKSSHSSGVFMSFQRYYTEQVLVIQYEKMNDSEHRRYKAS